MKNELKAQKNGKNLPIAVVIGGPILDKDVVSRFGRFISIKLEIRCSFITALHCYNIQELWYKFAHESFKKNAIQFCKEHELIYHYGYRQ